MGVGLHLHIAIVMGHFSRDRILGGLLPGRPLPALVSLVDVEGGEVRHVLILHRLAHLREHNEDELGSLTRPGE